MGPAGSGKTTVGELLASRLGWEFVDGDSFHSRANIEKMARGVALGDTDRIPWLNSIRQAMLQWDAQSRDVVLACSALKRNYRERLQINDGVKLVYLQGSYDLLRERLHSRKDHYAGEQLLASQLADLEEPAEAITLSAAPPPEEIVAEIRKQLALELNSPARPPESHVDSDLPADRQRAIETSVLSRLTWRLVPFLFLLYIVAYLDRINVGFAALAMQEQLKFSDRVYGLGAGMFFAGYFLFQVPSNLVLHRVGARRWIALLMIVWGAISSSMITVGTPKGFYILRFLLGSAEAGFFPGMILYLKSWFPEAARARAVALFMTAGPLSGFLGGPISGVLLGLHHWLGLAGWQWLFLVEGLPAVLLGAVVYFQLADRPNGVSWLTAEQRAWLIQTLELEKAASSSGHRTNAFTAFKNKYIWMLAFIYFGLNTCSYGISLWLPTLIHNWSSAGNFFIGVISAIPYLSAAVAMVLVGKHSDRTGERRWHVACMGFSGATALLFAAYASSLAAVVAAISVAMLSVSSMVGPFWALPIKFLRGTAAAVGIALINSIGNLGGFFGPTVIGSLRTSTGSFRGGFLIASASLALCGCVAPFVRPEKAALPVASEN
jgi:ACS family tartrate transporter-like MFS transporter